MKEWQKFQNEKADEVKEVKNVGDTDANGLKWNNAAYNNLLIFLRKKENQHLVGHLKSLTKVERINIAKAVYPKAECITGQLESVTKFLKSYDKRVGEDVASKYNLFSYLIIFVASYEKRHTGRSKS